MPVGKLKLKYGNIHIFKSRDESKLSSVVMDVMLLIELNLY